MTCVHISVIFALIYNDLFLCIMKKMSNRIHILCHKKTVKLLIFLLLMFLAFLLVEILKGEEEIYTAAFLKTIGCLIFIYGCKMLYNFQKYVNRRNDDK